MKKIMITAILIVCVCCNITAQRSGFFWSHTGSATCNYNCPIIKGAESAQYESVYSVSPTIPSSVEDGDLLLVIATSNISGAGITMSSDWNSWGGSYSSIYPNYQIFYSTEGSYSSKTISFNDRLTTGTVIVLNLNINNQSWHTQSGIWETDNYTSSFITYAPYYCKSLLLSLVLAIGNTAISSNNYAYLWTEIENNSRDVHSVALYSYNQEGSSSVSFQRALNPVSSTHNLILEITY